MTGTSGTGQNHRILGQTTTVTAWDRRGAPSSVTDPNGVATTRSYDTQGRLLAEHNAATGAMQREYVWIEDKLVGIVDDSTGAPTIEAVTTSQIDEPLLVTAADQSLLFDGYLDPYGNQRILQPGSFAMNLRLPGQYFQGALRLSQNWWRDYDPTLGRYIEADPIGIDGGQNVYAYVHGDPLNRADPMGLQAVNPLEATCVDSAQPACWAGLTLGALGVYEAGQAANALSNSQSKSKAGFCPTPNDDCKKLIADIYQAMERVENRAAAMASDKNGLFTRIFLNADAFSTRIGDLDGPCDSIGRLAESIE